jgi:CRP/FNR family transcriptional regulator, cyclic AMP receptor protein
MYKQLFNREIQDRMEAFFTHNLSVKGRIRAIEKNTIIDPENGDSIYIVLDGELNQILYSEKGEEVIFCRLQRGNIFGEMDFFDGERTCIITKAITACAISVVDRKTVERVLSEEPDIYRHFIHSIVRKYRILMLEKADNHFSDARGKIAHHLVRLAHTTSLACNLEGETPLPVNIQFTHEELANRINANRSTITSGLNFFKEQGLIEVNGRNITILNLESLKAFINNYLPE